MSSSAEIVDEAPTARTGPAAPHGHGLALAVICGAQLMIVLDATIVNVALPSIQRHLGFSIGNLVWITTAYSLTFGGLLLIGGRSGDLFGRRRMFMLGIAVFAIASLLGGFAQDETWLIITRGLQGVGGAIASPTALSLITTNFQEGPDRNRAMGIYAAMSGGGAAVGLLLGGVLTDLVSWRWVFFVNVPIAMLVLFLAPRVLAEAQRGVGRLDIAGATSATAGMIALVYGLTNAATHSWGATSTVAPLTAAVVLLTLFVIIETRVSDPMMPLSIFANRNRSASYAVMLCIAAAMFAMFYFLTLYLQEVLGYSPLKAGLAFLPTAFVIVGASAGVAQVVGRTGVRVPLLVGPALAAVAFIWLTQLSATGGYLPVLFPLIVLALGMGCTFVPITLTAVSGVEAGESGLASALLNTGQQVGGAIGLAVLSTISATAIRDRLNALHHTAGSGPPSVKLLHAATTHGYTRAFGVAAAMALLALLISFLGIRVPREPKRDAETAHAGGRIAIFSEEQ